MGVTFTLFYFFLLFQNHSSLLFCCAVLLTKRLLVISCGRLQYKQATAGPFAAAALYYFISSGLEVELQRRVSDTIIHRYENNATEPEIPLPFVKRRKKKIEAHYQGLYRRRLSAGRKAEEIPALGTFPTSHSGDFVPTVCVVRAS